MHLTCDLYLRLLTYLSCMCINCGLGLAPGAEAGISISGWSFLWNPCRKDACNQGKEQPSQERSQTCALTLNYLCFIQLLQAVQPKPFKISADNSLNSLILQPPNKRKSDNFEMRSLRFVSSLLLSKDKRGEQSAFSQLPLVVHSLPFYRAHESTVQPILQIETLCSKY